MSHDIYMCKPSPIHVHPIICNDTPITLSPTRLVQWINLQRRGWTLLDRRMAVLKQSHGQTPNELKISLWNEDLVWRAAQSIPKTLQLA